MNLNKTVRKSLALKKKINQICVNGFERNALKERSKKRTPKSILNTLKNNVYK